MKQIILESDIEKENFEDLLRVLYEFVNQYIKDCKNKDSWVAHYSETLSIKFPRLTFNEGYQVFLDKITKILDIMELSHLYCKITTPELYNNENHESVIFNKKFILNSLNNIAYSGFEELRMHLKNSITYGNN